MQQTVKTEHTVSTLFIETETVTHFLTSETAYAC